MSLSNAKFKMQNEKLESRAGRDCSTSKLCQLAFNFSFFTFHFSLIN